MYGFGTLSEKAEKLVGGQSLMQEVASQIFSKFKLSFSSDYFSKSVQLAIVVTKWLKYKQKFF